MNIKYVVRSFSDGNRSLEDNNYLCKKSEYYYFKRPLEIYDISIFDNEEDAIEAALKVTNYPFFEVVKIIKK